MIDLRYKNTPLFTISIALCLSTAAMAEAASAKVVPGSPAQPHTPDEALRGVTTEQLGQVRVVQPSSVFPRPSGVLPVSGKNTTPLPIQPIATRDVGSRDSLDRIIAGITNRPTAPVQAVQSKSKGQVMFTPRGVVIPASPQPAAAATSKPSVANIPLVATSTPSGSIGADLPFPEAKGSQEQTDSFITKPAPISNTVPSSNQWAIGISQFASQLTINSYRLVQSVRSSSSALLSMGAVPLAPSAVDSRLMLGTAVELSQSPALSYPNSSILSIQTSRPSVMKLLLTYNGKVEPRSAVALSVIGAHGFTNKPNV